MNTYDIRGKTSGELREDRQHGGIVGRIEGEK